MQFFSLRVRSEILGISMKGILSERSEGIGAIGRLFTRRHTQPAPPRTKMPTPFVTTSASSVQALKRSEESGGGGASHHPRTRFFACGSERHFRSYPPCRLPPAPRMTKMGYFRGDDISYVSRAKHPSTSLATDQHLLRHFHPQHHFAFFQQKRHGPLVRRRLLDL